MHSRPRRNTAGECPSFPRRCCSRPTRATVPGAVEVIRTYLELTDPRAIRPAGPPRVDGDVVIARVDPPDGATSRWFYEHVGAPHQWTDNLHRSHAEWQAWADTV